LYSFRSILSESDFVASFSFFFSSFFFLSSSAFANFCFSSSSFFFFSSSNFLASSGFGTTGMLPLVDFNSVELGALDASATGCGFVPVGAFVVGCISSFSFLSFFSFLSTFVSLSFLLFSLLRTLFFLI